MRNDLYIESRPALALMREALNLSAKPQEWLKNELLLQCKTIRNIKRGYKAMFERAQHWDCGRQDAWGDRLDHQYTRWEALKLAWRIQRGDGRYLMRQMRVVVGDLS